MGDTTHHTEYVVGPDGRTGRRRGAHADDQNGVCVWCNLCIDLHCCGRFPDRCPAHSDGFVDHSDPETTNNDGPVEGKANIGESAP